MKVSIVIVTYNIDSRILIQQIEAIRKFCKDENYEIVIVDNSDNEEYIEAIKHHTSKLNVIYNKTYAGSKDGSRSHAFAATIAYKLVRDLSDYVLFLDHDCLPVKPFSVIDILGDRIIAGLGQSSGKNTYFWPGCVMWNNTLINKNLIDFYPKPPLDTGAGFKEVVKEYGQDKCLFFDETYWENPHFTEGQYNYYSMIHKNTFMHFVNSSNWNPVEDNDRRINALITIAQQKIDDSK